MDPRIREDDRRDGSQPSLGRRENRALRARFSGVLCNQSYLRVLCNPLIVFQLIDPLMLSDLFMSLCFNLANTFTSNTELLPYFFEGMRDAIV